MKLPLIDLQTLIAECIDDCNRSRQNTTRKSYNTAVDDRDVDDLLAQARERLGVDVMPRAASGEYAPPAKRSNGITSPVLEEHRG